MHKLLITGGSGFIGSHTCLELLNNGYELYVLDSNINSFPDVIDKVKTIADSKNLHFYKGDPLTIYISKDGIDYKSVTLGEDDNFHYTVKAHSWFAMKSAGLYSLIGCTVAPGFDYKDFELAPFDWKPTNFNIS